jgi:hypothetical protein
MVGMSYYGRKVDSKDPAFHDVPAQVINPEFRTGHQLASGYTELIRKSQKWTNCKAAIRMSHRFIL